MSEWTTEQKEQLIAEYEKRMDEFSDEEKGAHSVEVCADLAKEYGKTNNGVRIILNKAGVYIKKTPTAKAATSGASTGSKRINKAEAHSELKGVISTIDQDLIDEEIISKLTGKAAQYLTGVIQQAVALQE